MTASSNLKSGYNLLNSGIYWLRSAFNLIGRIALGALVIFAAGIVAMAMAALGVLIALAALISRVSRPGAARPATHSYRASEASGEAGIILEARQTGKGWTVE